MSTFFKHFPQVEYNFFVETDKKIARKIQLNVADIFRNVDVDDFAIDNYVTYLLYDIQDGERPDVVSQKLYGTTDYHWTFFVVNNSLKNGLQDWPLSSGQLERFMQVYFDKWQVISLKTTFVPDGSYVYFDQDGIEREIIFSEIINTFSGLDLSPEFVRIVSDGKRFKVMYDHVLEQLWVTPEISDNSYSIDWNKPFYFTTSDENPEKEYEWKQSFLSWVSRNRPGFFNYSLKDSQGEPTPFNQVEQITYTLGTINTEQYSRGRNAPHHYEDGLGAEISRYDFLKYEDYRTRNRLVGGGKTIVSYSDYLNEINSVRSQIRVIAPIHVQDFVREYRKLLNS